MHAMVNPLSFVYLGYIYYMLPMPRLCVYVGRIT